MTTYKPPLTERLATLRAQPEKLYSDVHNYIIDYVLDQCHGDEEIRSFFTFLRTKGCVTGLVRDLIYYHETHAFYDHFFEDIKSFRNDMEALGVVFCPIDDHKNWYSWHVFEKVGHIVEFEIGLTRLPLYTLLIA